VHSRNVTFDVSDAASSVMPEIDPGTPSSAGMQMEFQLGSDSPEVQEVLDDADPEEDGAGELAQTGFVPGRSIDENAGHHPDRRPRMIKRLDPTNEKYKLAGMEGPPLARTRRGTAMSASVFIASVEELAESEVSQQQYSNSLAGLVHDFMADNPKDVQAQLQAAHCMATIAQKDMSWKSSLSGEHRANVLKAFADERSSLEGSILKQLCDGDANFAQAVLEATSGRWLLDIKRTGKFKCRGVKQGFKEDKNFADGPDFNYYAHVAKLISMRSALFRPRRRNRRLAVKDISTAFLQSHPYPDGQKKFLKMKNPVTGEWEYFEQSGPIYGEASAPVRWEDTIAPWLVEQGFERGKNDPCVFYHVERDLLVLLYVDDCLMDGAEEDVQWMDALLDTRFKCKESDWLTEDNPLDYIGMDLLLKGDRLHLSMEKYALQTIALFEDEDVKPDTVPIRHPVETDSPPLPPLKRRKWMTGMGMFGWLANTGRPDLAYSHSRNGQHMASPTESAYDNLLQMVRYLKSSFDLTLSVSLDGHDQPVSSVLHSNPLDCEKDWKFYCDSDFAGNTEKQNKRRSQNGFIATLGGAAVLWGSKVTSVAFAHPDIGEAHADMSSGAAEIYCTSNALCDFMHLSYVVDEEGMQFPKPIPVHMDNTAAIAFAKNTCSKSNLKHIDCRQEWVQVLRDKGIMTPIYVPTKENVADLFTKILDPKDFIRLRSMIMTCPDPCSA
jgi:hypothetical protein